jgi:hypothetical protein
MFKKYLVIAYLFSLLALTPSAEAIHWKRIGAVCAAAVMVSTTAFTVFVPKPNPEPLVKIEGDVEQSLMNDFEEANITRFLRKVKSEKEGIRFKSRAVTYYREGRKENDLRIDVSSRLHFTWVTEKTQSEPFDHVRPLPRLEVVVVIDDKKRVSPPYWSVSELAINERQDPFQKNALPQVVSYKGIDSPGNKWVTTKYSYDRGVFDLFAQSVVSLPGLNDSVNSGRCFVQIQPDGNGIKAVKCFQFSNGKTHAWVIEGPFAPDK